MRSLRLTLVAAVLAVVAAACAGGTEPLAEDESTPATVDTSSPTSTASAPTADGTSPGDPAEQLFAFQAPLITTGETYDASQLSGRDVAIWFWAPW